MPNGRRPECLRPHRSMPVAFDGSRSDNVATSTRDARTDEHQTLGGVTTHPECSDTAARRLPSDPSRIASTTALVHVVAADADDHPDRRLSKDSAPAGCISCALMPCVLAAGGRTAAHREPRRGTPPIAKVHHHARRAKALIRACTAVVRTVLPDPLTGMRGPVRSRPAPPRAQGHQSHRGAPQQLPHPGLAGERQGQRADWSALPEGDDRRAPGLAAKAVGDEQVQHTADRESRPRSLRTTGCRWRC